MYRNPLRMQTKKHQKNKSKKITLAFERTWAFFVLRIYNFPSAHFKPHRTGTQARHSQTQNPIHSLSQCQVMNSKNKKSLERSKTIRAKYEKSSKFGSIELSKRLRCFVCHFHQRQHNWHLRQYADRCCKCRRAASTEQSDSNRN